MKKLWLRNVKVLSLKLAHLGTEAKQSDNRPFVTNVSVLDIWNLRYRVGYASDAVQDVLGNILSSGERFGLNVVSVVFVVGEKCKRKPILSVHNSSNIHYHFWVSRLVPLSTKKSKSIIVWL